MTLEARTKLGPYEILEPIGAGGMGEVYRARDTRLDRDVAIKVLPEAFARDPERMARFQREAKVLASLNHPNIAGIYGFEESGGKRLLVMELAEGPTLAERLDRGPIPIRDALEFANGIATALEAAHERGVIHRDLKPANVKVTPEGTVKVLDFGLAKAMCGDATGTDIANSPTITAAHTRPGVVLGTAAYMSPEQARGKPLDKRTDVWSFGCVLYECLSGHRPFHGDTATDLIARILEREPDWSALPPDTPPVVQLLLRRCLAKDRSKRLRDIGDARIELENAIADPASSSLGLAVSALRRVEPGKRARVARYLLFVAIIVLVGGLGLVAGRRLTPPTAAPVVRKYEIALVHEGGWGLGQPAVSPDGAMIAYVDQDRVWIRRLDSFDAREVADSEQGIIPFWSPDGHWLGFAREDKLLKVPASGGRPVIVTKAPGVFSPVGGAAWSRDGRIYFSTGDTGILEVSADGGEPRMVVAPELEDDDDFHELALLPDGRSVVFSVHSRSRPWYLAAWDGNQRKVVLQLEQHIRAPAYSPTGHVLFQRFANDQSVWALPFSVDRVEATGGPFLVAAGDGDPSVSDTGVLAITRRTGALEGGELVSVNLASGKLEPLLNPGGVYYDPAFSPDGTMIALAGFNLNAVDLWLMDIRQGTRTRLTFDEGTNEILPTWSPDGREIAFARTAASTFERIAADDTIRFLSTNGSGETREPIPGGYPTLDREWTYVAFIRTESDSGRDIYFMPLDGASEAKPLLHADASEEHPALSPDGHWLAYTSNESGAQHVYLTRFPSGQGKWQVSTQLGVFPEWSADGARLYYLGGAANVYEVQITIEPRVMLTQPRQVIDGAVLGVNAYLGFTVSPDGQSLIAIRTGRAEGAAAIGVIENWFAEFKDRP